MFLVSLMETYQIGEVAYGSVTGLENYGIFLTFDDGYTGLIHISELSEHFVKNVGDYAQIGDVIPCIILEIDEKVKQMKCSIKNTDYAIDKETYIDHGFAPLKKQLPIWMEEKLKDL